MSEKIEQWVNNARTFGGGFISTFAEAYQRADTENRLVLQPALERFMEKYPHYNDTRFDNMRKGQ